MFYIKCNFNNSSNMSVLGILNSSYEKSNISILGNSISSQTITKVRHNVDKSTHNTYLEFYYNSDAANAISVELIGILDVTRRWELIDKWELTQETVENVVTYSITDLELLGDIKELLPTTDKTGNHTVPDLSKYRFLLFSLRGTTNGGWYTSTIFPTKLFRARGCEVIVESNNLDASFVYVSDTTINLNRVATNRGASVYGIK